MIREGQAHIMNELYRVETEYKLSPRVTLHSGDAVKIEGKHGLFRFIRVERPYDETKEPYAVIVGPVAGVGNPRLIERLYPLSKLRSAGKATADSVAPSPEVNDLNNRAKGGRRK